MRSFFFMRTSIRISFIFFWLSVIGVGLFFPLLFHKRADQKTINVLVWSTALRSELVTRFEKETGIKVYVNYCETNEELLVKLSHTTGGSYDMIMPSDHIVPLLIQEDLLEKLDHTRLEFLPFLHKNLLNCYFDPGNIYTVPFLWGIYGIGIDTTIIAPEYAYEHGWSLFFNKKMYAGSFGMVDDAREVAGLAAYYLYGDVSIPFVQPDQLRAIKDLLLAQKDRIAMYTEDRADYVLLSEIAPLVVAPHYDILRAVKHDARFAFIIPKDGSFILIDSCAIPKKCAKKDLVYQFLNYIFRRDVMADYAQKFDFLPPRTDLVFLSPFFSFPDDSMGRLHFFCPLIPQKFLSQWWFLLKA